MIVVDTNILVDLLRQKPAALSWWYSAPDAAASEITRTEVLRGMRANERTRTTGLFKDLAWQDIDAAVSQRAGELGRKYRRSHHGIDAADLGVAATAQLLDAPLATMNVRHFPMFEGLEPPY